MADEILDLDLEQLDAQIDNTNKVEKRITDLSQKVKTTAEERDAEAKAKAEAETRATAAEKERDFFKDFSTQSSKYPGATDHQDKIKEKVMLGYSMEDAVVSVLNAEGKLNASPAPRANDVAGGSAVNQPNTGSDKAISEMTKEEMRAKLLEAAQRGDISIT